MRGKPQYMIEIAPKIAIERKRDKLRQEKQMNTIQPNPELRVSYNPERQKQYAQ